MESFNNLEKKELTSPLYEIDISKAWNSEGEALLFIEALKKLPIYREGLLYSGFDGDHIDVSFSSKDKYIEGGIFCCEEKELSGVTGGQSALDFAIDYKNPAIAVYDPIKLTKVPFEFYAYTVDDPSALIAIIKIKI